MIRVMAFCLAALTFTFGLFAASEFTSCLTDRDALYHVLALFGVGLALVATGCFRWPWLYLVLTGASPFLLWWTYWHALKHWHSGHDGLGLFGGLLMDGGMVVLALTFWVSLLIWCLDAARRHESDERE